MGEPADRSGATEPAVLYEQSGHVVTITYNRPERLNAINGAMREGLNAAWDRTHFQEKFGHLAGR